jgi:hypothetical protein
MAKRRSKKKKLNAAARARTSAHEPLSVTPEDFAPYAEAELRAVAAKLVGASGDGIKTVLSETDWGRELLAKADAADHVARPLLAVWGPPGLAKAA